MGKKKNPYAEALKEKGYALRAEAKKDEAEALIKRNQAYVIEAFAAAFENGYEEVILEALEEVRNDQRTA